MPIQATPTPAKGLLDPANHALLLIDFQAQTAFATRSIAPELLRNNAALVAHGAAGFNVPTILATVAETSFSGPLFTEVAGAFPGQASLDRSTMNAWEDEAVINEVNRIGLDRFVFAGLWTSVSVAAPVLCALEQGYEAYVITDASGDISAEAHERALARMIQAGARPITSLQYLLELQRDWARAETYDLATTLAIKWGGALGLGITYARTMFDEPVDGQ